MAPALRMTRSIKEKLPCFSRSSPGFWRGLKVFGVVPCAQPCAQRTDVGMDEFVEQKEQQQEMIKVRVELGPQPPLKLVQSREENRDSERQIRVRKKW